MTDIPDIDDSQGDEDLNEYTKDILRSFCAWERINYPKTVALFKQQSTTDQLNHLQAMKQVIEKRKREQIDQRKGALNTIEALRSLTGSKAS